MSSDTARLLVQDAAGSVWEAAISKSPFTIGRQADSDLVLQDNRVSRRHARIVRTAQGYVLEDSESRHGTHVNGARIERRVLQDGDRINLGFSDDCQITFVSAGNTLQDLLEKVKKTTKSSAPTLRHLNLLLQLAQMLHRAAALQDVLATVVDSALEMSGAERGILFLQDENGILAKRMERGQVRLPGQPDYSEDLIRRAMRSGRQEAENEPSSETGYETIVIPTGQRGALAVPLQKLPVAEASGEETIRLASPELLGVLYLENRSKPAAISSVDRQALETLAIESAMIIENARLLRIAREQERSRHEMTLARSIQQSLLPRELPQADYLLIHAVSWPCRTVGGDYYDVIHLPKGRYGLTVADVSGKGLPAAMMSMTLQGAFSSLAAADTELAELFRRVNAFLYERTPPEMYATLFYGVAEPDGCFRFVNAGHVPPYLVRASGEIQTLEAPSFPLGLFPKAEYGVMTLQLEPGDQILVFSDGLTEAQNEVGEMLGESRIKQLAESCARNGAPPSEVCASLVAAAENFAGAAPQMDDMTVAVLGYAHPKDGI